MAVVVGQGTTPVYPATPLSTPPTIDGDIQSSEWASAAHGEGFSDADTNLASDERAEWWLAYDGEFIYFAGRVYTDPNKIVADEYRPNVGLRGNDNFTLLLDLGGNGTSQDSFGVNAQGATSINLSGGRAAKVEWVGEFDAQGRRTETGWQVEARIPWQIVTPVPQGQRNARFNFLWYRSNKGNTYVHYYTQRNASRDPVWEGVNVPVIRGQRGVSLLPYAFGGVNDNGDFISRAGVDLKYNLPGGLNLIGTINPDDVNIEADVLGLDFSYFERLPDEVRPFFLEGNRYIRTGFDARLFASQRMPEVTAGIKVYGDTDQRTQLGVLSVADFGDRSAQVFSVSQRLNERQRYDFGYVRYDETGASNDGFMLNLNQQLGGTGYYFNTQFTRDSVRDTGTRLSAGFNHQDGGLQFGAGYDEVTPNFFPRVGFSRDRNFRSVYLYGEVQQQYQGGPILETETRISANRAWRINGDDYREGLSGSYEVKLRNGLGFEVGANWSEFLQNNDRSFGIGAGYPFNDPYRNVQISYSRGYFAGDDRDQWEIRLRLRPTPRTQVAISSEFVAYRGHETQQIFAVSHDLSKFEGISMRLIRRDNDYNWSASYRLSGRRGNELFFIVGDPNARSFQRRLALKFVMPVTIGG
ncbi:MAG: hypothetical protein KF812_13225 [Fimbriimonadaceae bacterium]|nr:hypothetical protein [Fimbriimonadaceae bacterium]